MKIIGHRGAAGLVAENTLASIEEALKYAVDGIEFDVRQTADGHFVLCHDPDLMVATGSDTLINKLTLADIKKMPTLNGQPVATLAGALELAGNRVEIIFVEHKDDFGADKLLKVLMQYRDLPICITSFKHGQIKKLVELKCPFPLFLAERHNPFEIINTARQIGAQGITLNYWILNPYTYWICRFHGLKVMAYTVNNRFSAWWLKLFYYRIYLCTNYPNRFADKNRLRRQQLVHDSKK